jgi:OmpA-OmpF porin, OOP family
MNSQKLINNKPKFLQIVVSAGVLAFLGTSAVASAEGWYGGVGFGQSKVDSESIPGFSGSIDDKDDGWKAFGGYQFNNYGAVEFGYVDLGTVSVAKGKILGLSASEEDKVKGYSLSYVGTLPIASQFSVLGRVGFFRWDVDSSCSLGSINCSASATGTDLTYGLGAQFDFSKSIGARLEWEQFNDVGDQNTASGDVNLLSVSLVFKFQ